MKRIKRHKIKREVPESSSHHLKDNEEHDLAYYIHDRVELMHQVFSVIKPKELKVMAPQCVQHISIDDLQELCTEELLGISSKRLCAILDGAEPPTDTESSSSEPLETISLDSISSDDEILSQQSSKNKKHKHKKHKSKNKHKRKESNSEKEEDKSKASRAGLTVLELLELQARARAIRAQLQQDVTATTEVQEGTTEKHDSSDEIEIKEEPAVVVEISSEDEKPNIENLLVKPPSPSKENTQERTSTSVTKRVNDLIITVPQTKPTRKIKLKRNKSITTSTPTADVSTKNIDKNIQSVNKEVVTNKIQVVPDNKNNKKNESKTETKTKSKKRQKKKDKEKEGSDHDEITLQLSDSEKMDLLDFDRKNYDNLTSSGSEDSESSSESNESDNSHSSNDERKITKSTGNVCDKNEPSKADTVIDQNTKIKLQIEEKVKDNEMKESHEVKETSPVNLDNDELMDKTDLSDKINEASPVVTKNDQKQIKSPEQNNSNTSTDNQPKNEQPVETPNTQDQLEEGEIVNEEEKKLSDGEISEHTSEVVCISDDENIDKKKKKKEKKCKKEKKNKKSKSDFREDADQNFYNEKQNDEQKLTEVNKITIDDDNYEILELSDDSSCYDVEGVSISKEPTKAEIEALSAKIDERIHTNTREETENNEADTNEEFENISWRDRYLDSKKVKKVLTTANILNALRKKNKELKKKLEESKNMEEKTPEIEKPADVVEESANVLEGSIDHFNTLQGSTKYVDPIDDSKLDNGGKVTKELEMDAKRLLKMYKKLLKHNDMYKKKDPNKKKKKKLKKNKEKKKSNDSTQQNIT